jgi:hypothetical protein
MGLEKKCAGQSRGGRQKTFVVLLHQRGRLWSIHDRKRERGRNMHHGERVGLVYCD